MLAQGAIGFPLFGIEELVGGAFVGERGIGFAIAFHFDGFIAGDSSTKVNKDALGIVGVVNRTNGDVFFGFSAFVGSESGDVDFDFDAKIRLNAP